MWRCPRNLVTFKKRTYGWNEQGVGWGIVVTLRCFRVEDVIKLELANHHHRSFEESVPDSVERVLNIKTRTVCIKDGIEKQNEA